MVNRYNSDSDFELRSLRRDLLDSDPNSNSEHFPITIRMNAFADSFKKKPIPILEFDSCD